MFTMRRDGQIRAVPTNVYYRTDPGTGGARRTW